jgi:hypothetical protein
MLAICSSKRQGLSELHSVTGQNIALFILVAVKGLEFK